MIWNILLSKKIYILTSLQSTHSIQLSVLVFQTGKASLINLQDPDYVFSQTNRQQPHDLNEESCVVSLLFSTHEVPYWRAFGNIMNESLSAGRFGFLRYPAQAQFSFLIETPNNFSNNTPLWEASMLTCVNYNQNIKDNLSLHGASEGGI